MKVFFGLLLVANIAFAAFQWLLPYDQMFAQPSGIPPAEELQLLSDSDIKPVSESEVIAEVEAETRAIEKAVAAIESEMEAEQVQQLTEEETDPRICYTIGPIKGCYIPVSQVHHSFWRRNHSHPQQRPNQVELRR